MSDVSGDTPQPAPDHGSQGYLTPEEAIENAPRDCIEIDVDGVFSGKVRIRSLTAAAQARVKQAGLVTSGRTPSVAWAEMERTQFRLGVIAPKFSADQVRTLHETAGPSFAKVIAELDRITGTDKEELRKAQESFPESGE